MEKKEKIFTGPEKAAILLLSLGDDVASKIMQKLEYKEITTLGSHMSYLGNISSNVIDDISKEFYIEATSGEGGVIVGGKEYVRKILEKVMDPERVQEIMGNLNIPGEEGGGGGGLEALRSLEPKTIASFIRNEHPQTSAIILVHLAPDQAAGVLNEIEDARIKKEIVIRMATLDSVSPEVIKDLDEALMAEFAAAGDVERSKIGGVQSVAEILNQLDQATEKAIFEDLETDNPDLADEIRQLMFVFEDLLKVDERGIQAILKEVSSDDLLISLKTATGDLKERFFKNMSKRAAEMAREDLEAMGPVRLSEVETAQQGILKIVKRLEEEGKLILGGSGGEEFV